MKMHNTLMLCAALVGCDELDSDGTTGEESTLEPAPAVSELTEDYGCGDITFMRYSEDQTLALVYKLDSEITVEAFETQEPITISTNILEEGSLELHQGSRVNFYFCNDFTDDWMSLDHTWVAIDGQVTITVVTEGVEQGNARPAWGTITIQNAHLVRDGAEDVFIDEMTWESYVGWMQG